MILIVYCAFNWGGGILLSGKLNVIKKPGLYLFSGSKWLDSIDITRQEDLLRIVIEWNETETILMPSSTEEARLAKTFPAENGWSVKVQEEEKLITFTSEGYEWTYDVGAPSGPVTREYYEEDE